MSGVQDQLEIKFRLIDGSDIGPKSFPAAASVANLKENILAQWPKGDGGLSFVDVSTSRPLLYNLCSEASVPEKFNLERENGPRTVKDVKLISGGRILENNRTVGECRSPLFDIPGGVTTMHVVVQPLPPEKEKKAPNDPKQNKCVCVIL